MNRKLSDSSLLILFLALFILGGLFLSFASNQALDPNYKKNWWTASFDRPTDNSTVFTIANHTPESEFSYSFVSEHTSIPETTLSIPTGLSQTIMLDNTDIAPPFRIILHHSGETREIYKRSKE